MIKTSIFKESLQKKSIVRLHYQNVVKENYDGVVVHIGKKIIILACVDNFEFDGYQVLLKKRIRGYRNSSIEQAFTKIVTANKENKKLNPPKWVCDLNNVEDLIKAFKKRKIWPAIETIFNKDNCFYIGPISQIKGLTPDFE